MKIVKFLNTKEERFEYLKGIWKTEEFQESFNNKGYVYQKTKGFLTHSRVIAQMTDVKLEHSHFYSWFNILIEKEYSNPVVADLYNLHEIIHIATMEYDGDLSFEDWSWKMLMNEINASVESEVLVYKHLSIRSKSFDFPIWADEILSSAMSTSDIFLERLRAASNPRSETEKKIAQYKEQNFIWMDLWKPFYKEIETFMATKPDESQMRNWIDSNSKDGILFKDQAESFSWLYWKNNPNKKF